jgi:hypothetical protein
MTNYILWERKDLRGNTFYALPREHETAQVREVLTNAGEINVDPGTFGKTQPIRLVGSIKEHSHTLRNGVYDILKELRKCGLDYDTLVRDEKLMARLLGHSQVFGDLYLATFNLNSGTKGPLTLNGLYLAGIGEGELVRAASPSLCGIPDSDLSQLASEASAKIERVGRMRAHFSSLQAKTLDEEIGYGMDPRIVLQAGPFRERTLKDFKTW